MADICCKGCASDDLCKNGIVRGHQRYLCKSCGMNFTNTPARGKPAAMKDMALAMYTIGGMSFCGIGKILGVSDVAVLNWVRPRRSSFPTFRRRRLPAGPPVAARLSSLTKCGIL